MIIAEIGRNHLGKIDLANKYIDELLLTKVDGISFQIREKEYYQTPEKKNFQWDTSNYLNLSIKIKKGKKKFGMALADPSLVNFFESIGTDFYKVIRNDIKNEELISELIKTNKKIFISTGMCSDDDISNFIEKYGKLDNITLNHTQLSNSVKDCNLKSIESMKKYGLQVSYGNHCENKNVLYMALMFNPSDIMFYVKACNKLKYPDDKHAIILNKVRNVIDNLNTLKKAKGNGFKIKMENTIK